jgi:hypothetical protein
MQSISPHHMLGSALIAFTNSTTVNQLTRVSDDDWIQGSQATDVIDAVYNQVLLLERFAELLQKMMEVLSNKGLHPELKICDGDQKFQSVICKAISNSLISAYGVTPSLHDVGPAYFAVLIKEKHNNVIASALVDFRPYPDNEFVSRMEAVEKPWQNQKVGTELFHFIESSVRFMVLLDDFVQLNLRGEEYCTIKAYVDSDAPCWQDEMMVKLGFSEEDDSEDDIEYYKVIPLNVEDEDIKFHKINLDEGVETCFDEQD